MEACERSTFSLRPADGSRTEGRIRFPALVNEWKQQAAERALAYVEDGMLVGLGTGSRRSRFVDLVGARVKQGLSITCVPTSEATRVQAERLGIALTTLDDVPFLDLTVDGADELDPDLRPHQGRRRRAAAREDRRDGLRAWWSSPMPPSASACSASSPFPSRPCASGSPPPAP